MSRTCLRCLWDNKYINFDDFSDMSDAYRTQIFKRFKPEENIHLSQVAGKHKPANIDSVLTDKDFLSLHDVLLNMSALTGLFIIVNRDEETYTGTGFVAKIRKYADNDPVRAVITVTTAYHLFSDEESQIPPQNPPRNPPQNPPRNPIQNPPRNPPQNPPRNPSPLHFEQANEIFEQAESKLFKLEYNRGDVSRDELVGYLAGNPTLSCCKLLDTDKDVCDTNDWCAIECEIEGAQVIQDLEDKLRGYQKGMEELYKTLYPKYRNVNLVVIIGHPHSNPKKISIGEVRSFQNVLDKEILKEVRDHQIWCRYSYDALTCTGSSGSPIFKWGQPISGFGYWFGHPHNHCSEGQEEDGRVYYSRSTIGVENVVAHFA